MADRYDWDRDRERDREMDRERGSANRDRDYRWSQGPNPEWNRERENWRGGTSGEFNPQYRNREDAGRYSETGEQGDWGRQGNWGSFGNRPYYNRENNWNTGRQHDSRNEYQGGYSGRDYPGGNQGRDRDFGGQFDRDSPSSGSYSQGRGSDFRGGSSYGSYGGGSYQGGMGSFGGGMGSYGERGRFSGRGPKGWQRSDERIKEDVNERLTDHPHIDASEIEVAVKNGEITLTGTVEDRNTKRQVEEVAEQVSGVKEVHNQIRVQQNHQQPAMHGQGSSSSTGTSGSSKK